MAELGQAAGLVHLAGLAAGAVDTVALAPIVAPLVSATIDEASAPTVEPETSVASEAPAQTEAPVQPEAPAAILLTQDGAKVLQSGADVPSELRANVTIDTISYTAEGAVQLGGRGQGAAFVRLYLDGKDLSTLEVAADGQWTATLLEIEPGIYTLRADQIDSAGKVTSRFETPFKRETIEALMAAAAPPVAPMADEVAGVVVAVPALDAKPEDTPLAPAQTEAVEAPVSAAPAAEPAAVAAETEIATAGPTADAVPLADVTTKAETAAPAVAVETPPPSDQIIETPAVVAETPVPAENQSTPVATAEPAPATDATKTAPAEVVAQPESTDQPVVAAEPAPDPAPVLVTVTVQPGFTLWRIAKEQFGEGIMYVQVYEANKAKIRDPDLIYPGQVFTLPGSE